MKHAAAWKRVATAFALIVLCAGPAAAQVRDIVIPQEPVSLALKALGQQTGQNILFTPSSVAGLNSHAVQGRMTAREAADALLTGTGLVALPDGEHGLLVERAPQVPSPAPAPAQEAAAPALPLEQVIVSSSRITSGGFNAPTPTTVVSADQLDRSAQPNIFDTIARLPALEGSTGISVNTNATSTGLNGLSALGLRGLGTMRTLVLLDSQRVVPANVNGVADISALPQLLIQRVDVVTGGASASWGSDAVAGVINFITDRHFNGFKANLLTGLTSRGDDPNITLQLAGGRDLAGGRAHLEVSAEYSYSAGLNPVHGVDGFGLGPGQGIGGRDWNLAPGVQMYSIGATPPGQPQYTYGVFAQSYQQAKYGLITAGPLQGTAFGVGGAPFNFVYGSNGVPARDAAGTVIGCANSICFGGDQSSAGNNGTTLADTLTRGNLYARLSYELGRDAEIYATINLGTVWSLNTPNSGVGKNANLTISCDNPFVPATIATQCGADGITSFQFGTENAQFPQYITVRARRDQKRLVLGGEGRLSLGDRDWAWNSYFQHGENDTAIHVRDISLNPRYVQAIDAIAGPQGPMCRSAVARAAGCVAMNILGDVPQDPAALAYVIPSAGPYQQTHERQDVFSLALNGVALENWAGPLSLAAGLEFREEAYRVRADPYGSGVTADNPSTTAYPADPVLSPAGNNWFAGNFHNAAGNYHVSEGFLESALPLFDDARWGRADLDLAARLTIYSTSGQIVTWKVGGTWDTPLDGVRLRLLQSRDVRSPNLSELFAANVTTNGTVTNDFTGNRVTILNVASGNTTLRPEKSQTTEVGLVFYPSWLPGLHASLDYYRIAVKGEIASLTPQQVVDLCYGGNTAVCNSAITTTDGGPPQTSPFAQVISRLFNLSAAVTDGFDLETDYDFSLDALPGTFNLRALVNHTSKFITDPGIPGQPIAESAGNMTLGPATASNVPLWKAFLTETFQDGPFELSLTERWISDGVFDKMFVACAAGCPLPTIAHPTINTNFQAGALYLDLGASYRVSEDIQLYMKVDNVADIAPPPSPLLNAQSYGVNPALYDVIGRMIRIGVRVAR